jgi:phosphoglycerol transferase MdoB-like AlkP superfamily enzyme
MAGRQDENTQPFLSVFFSLSNHHPFNLPKDNSADIAASGLGKMQKTIKYTDRALGAYFETVRRKSWYKNTIFIITGDHCFHEESDPRRNFIDNFNVPLFMIGPGLEPGFDDRIGQHISVMPTLIELMQLNTMHASTGLSLLGDAERGFAINNLMNVATLAKGDIAYSSSFERMQSVCSYDIGKWNEVTDRNQIPSEEMTLLEHQLRCLFQVFHNTRVNNTLQMRPSSPISLAD